jgi:hypothetical protein
MKYIVSTLMSLLLSIYSAGYLKVSLAASASANLTLQTVSADAGGNSFEHIVIVMEENTDYQYIIGSSSAPYLNGLASTYGLATQYYANTHPSIGNYFELTTGQILTNDDTQTPISFPVSANNIVRRLLAAGKTWKSYAESLPSIGYTGGDSGNYAVRHNPLAYFTDVQNNSTQKNNLVPFEDTNVGFRHDVNNNTLPNYSFVVPNILDDMHSGSISAGDSWLQTNIGSLINNPTLMQNTLVLILFDESGIPPASSGIDDNTFGGGRIYGVLVSPKVLAGYKSTTFIQHQSFLREALEGLGLSINLADAGTAPSLAEFLSANPEEFVGPFPSWLNVKTNYGAVGDGVHDDTTNIQNCINAVLAATATQHVCYFPAGTYAVNSQLTLNGVAGTLTAISLIGHDPGDTGICWGASGAAGGTMIRLNGIDYSRFNRLTFNGLCAPANTNMAGILIDQSYDGTTGNFDTGNEFADDVFVNATAVGYQCGNAGNGCAETVLVRDKFANLNSVAEYMANFNALDIWNWYNEFFHNAQAISDSFNGGQAVSVMNSLFLGQTNTDIAIGTLMASANMITLNNNYSYGSNQFIRCASLGFPDELFLQGNTILDTTLAQAVDCPQFGPMVLLDNRIRSLGTTTPVVRMNNGAVPDLFSMGNTYTVGTANCGSAISSSGRCHSTDDTVVSSSSLTPNPPALPGTPQNYSRTIKEASPNGSGTTCSSASPCAIATAISQACSSGTTRPVAHIQPGSHNITSTIIVPANCDVQIIGDGMFSTPSWGGAARGAVFQFNSPSKAIIRDLKIGGSNTATGIDVKGADQTGSRVWMEELYTDATITTGLLVDSLDNTNVELHDPQITSNGAVGLSVIGGASAAGGNWLGGATNIFNGQSSQNSTLFTVSNSGHFSSRQFWNDFGGAGGGPILTASGTGGAVSLMGTIAAIGSGQASVSLTNFSGASAIIGLNSTEPCPGGPSNEVVSGTGTGNNLNLGAVGVPSVAPFSDTTSPADTSGFLDGQRLSACGSSTVQVTESGSSAATFLRTAFAQLRAAQPTLPIALPSGITDVRLYRVNVEGASYGVHLEH